MKISVIDAGNYLKGLLLLIRKDRKVTASEIQLTKRIGTALGFERRFCDNAIEEILDNNYIVDAPPEFSTKILTEKFVKDGLVLASSDNEVHPSEEEWLRSTAEKNGLDSAWYRHVLAAAAHRKHRLLFLEVDGLAVEYC